MFFDFEATDAKNVHKLMTATIVPRPIAWVVTRSADGRLNAAPFSFFNMFCSAPPTVCLGIGSRAAGTFKDTARNIDETGEFAINLVSEDVAARMNVTSAEFEYGIDELEHAGLTAAPSQRIAPPWIAESPVAFECVRRHLHPMGTDHVLVIGQVLAMHIRDDAVIDAARGHVDTSKLALIGRMHGGGMYVRLTDTFDMPRPLRSGR